MKTISEFGERVRLLRSNKNLSQQEFADQMEVSRSYLASIETGRKEPSFSFVSSLIGTFGIEPNWFFGVGSSNPDEAETVSQFVPIPRYTVSASAGPGAIAGDYLDVSYYAFSLKWIKRRHLDHKMLNVIEVRGDSMEPRLSAGDLILIDRAQTDPTDGNTYVLRLGEELVVKNMQRIDRETIALISNNTIYPPRQVRAVDIGPTEEVDIIGRVVASMHEW
ncbi:XRE family transcriptional regulator [Paracoccus jiaweipingae]|uniref:XRE family transcriptional regulator n=1 Tax=Paracoccus sp. p2-l61 TaxID=3366950 RepID=UPI0037AC54B1